MHPGRSADKNAMKKRALAVWPSGNWSIKATVFIAPAIIIVLMFAAFVVFDQALRQQQAVFLNVVQGPLVRATTTTTKLLVAVSEVQADVLRYAQLRPRFSPEDNVLNSLRHSILSDRKSTRLNSSH